MARRQRSSPFEDLVSLVARLPWWACLLLGLVSFLVLRALAALAAAPVLTQPGQLGAVVAQTMWKTFALIGEFVVPVACVLAAGVSGYRQRRRQALVSGVARSPAADALNGMSWRDGRVFGGLLMAALSSAFAQTSALPAPSRTVFKCVVAGKMVYSDEPCPAAVRIDVQPTRGMGKTAGTDVQQERTREMVADAVKPLSGMTPQQFEMHRRRVYISAATKSECTALDTDLLQLETQERLEPVETRSLIQRQLFEKRKRYRELKC